MKGCLPLVRFALLLEHNPRFVRAWGPPPYEVARSGDGPVFCPWGRARALAGGVLRV